MADYMWGSDYAIKIGAERPTWDEYGLTLAWAVATRADCSRRKVGAVIMGEDHRIVSCGYNGAPAGQPGCLSGHCPRSFTDVPPGSDYSNCNAIHAERNACDYATYGDMIGATIYITSAPCLWCHRHIRLMTPIRHIKWPTGEVKIS